MESEKVREARPEASRHRKRSADSGG